MAGVPPAAGVLYPAFGGLLLSPMIASAAMSFSSGSVIATRSACAGRNSRGFEPDQDENRRQQELDSHQHQEQRVGRAHGPPGDGATDAAGEKYGRLMHP